MNWPVWRRWSLLLVATGFLLVAFAADTVWTFFEYPRVRTPGGVSIWVSDPELGVHAHVGLHSRGLPSDIAVITMTIGDEAALDPEPGGLLNPSPPTQRFDGTRVMAVLKDNSSRFRVDGPESDAFPTDVAFNSDRRWVTGTIVDGFVNWDDVSFGSGGAFALVKVPKAAKGVLVLAPPEGSEWLAERRGRLAAAFPPIGGYHYEADETLEEIGEPLSWPASLTINPILDEWELGGFGNEIRSNWPYSWDAHGRLSWDYSDPDDPTVEVAVEYTESERNRLVVAVLAGAIASFGASLIVVPIGSLITQASTGRPAPTTAGTEDEVPT